MTREELYKLYDNKPSTLLDDALISRLTPLTGVRFDDLRLYYESDTEFSQAEAAEDVETFFELLRLCYAGYEYYAARVDFDKVKAEIIADLNIDQITRRDIANAIYSHLSPVINDSHFAIFPDEALRFTRLYHAFFTGLTVSPDGDGYTVVVGTEEITTGYTFDAGDLEGYLFETLPAHDGTRRYLVGVYTDKLPESLNIGELTLPLHACRTDSVSYDGSVMEREEKGIPVVHHSAYDNGVFNWDYDSFRRSGASLRDAPHLIWSVLSNPGGNSNYPMHFIDALNDNAVWEMQVVVLNNPLLPVGCSENVHRFDGVHLSEQLDMSKSSYNGTLYVLQNKGVASSGEAALMYARSVKNVRFIGTASMGCGQYGECRLYCLPHSHLAFQMGYKVFNMDGFEEGKGLYPDYWLDSDDPIGDVAAWIRCQ